MKAIQLSFRISAAFFAAIMTLGVANASTVGWDWINGKIQNVTSSPAGLMVMMDDSLLPTNCSSSGSTWMLIPQVNSAMISLFLTYWAAGKRDFTLYGNPVAGTYCTLNQIDPVD